MEILVNYNLNLSNIILIFHYFFTKVSNLNDLWKFDGYNWTWISGDNTINSPGIYGIQGIPSSSNIPGARYYSTGWIDSSNNLWLFGGEGFDSYGNYGKYFLLPF